MVKNYFKIARRSLWRNKIFSVIKIPRLSIGFTVCMLIFLYTKDEISSANFMETKFSFTVLFKHSDLKINSETKAENTNTSFV